MGMRHALALIALLAAGTAQACGTGTPEYRAGRDAFYQCFGDHLDEQQGTTTAPALADRAVKQWCASELQRWYGAMRDGCPAASDQQNAQGYAIFESETSKGLADMIQATRNRAH